MKFLFRWCFRLLVLALLLGVAFLVLKDALLKEVVEDRLAAATGLEVRIDHLEARLLKPTLTIEGLRLYNPAAFGGSPFLDVRELHVEYDRPALFRRVLLLRLLRVDARELTLVRDAAGRWNYAALNERLKTAGPERGSMLSLKFGGVEVLNLSLDEAKCYSMTAPDRARVFPLDARHEIFLDLRRPADFARVAERLARKWGLKPAPPPPGAARPPANR